VTVSDVWMTESEMVIQIRVAIFLSQCSPVVCIEDSVQFVVFEAMLM